jgi:hypothetical protein
LGIYLGQRAAGLAQAFSQNVNQRERLPRIELGLVNETQDLAGFRWLAFDPDEGH